MFRTLALGGAAGFVADAVFTAALLTAAPLTTQAQASARMNSAMAPATTPAMAAGIVPQDLWSYRIARGDTLVRIAAAQLGPGSDWRRLQKLNRIANPRRLQPGQALNIPLAWLRVQPVRAEVLHVQGEVRVQRAGATPEAVAAGATLGSGDLLLAGPDSALALKFADGSRLLVRPQTQVRFERLVHVGAAGVPDTRLRLDSGSIDSRVQPAVPGRRYEIGTPSVNLGVRGTEFRTQVEPQSQVTWVEVIEGSVAAGTGTTTGAATGAGASAAASRQPTAAIAAGFGAVAQPGQALSTPYRLLEAPDLAGVPPLLERVPLRLAWRALAGASSYRAQVYPDPATAGNTAADAGQRLLLDGRFNEAAARWTDLPDGRYELRVRGIDAQGLEGRDARQAFVLKARPEPPFTRQPRASATLHGDAAQFAWTQAEGIASYRFQLSEGDDFSTPRLNLNGLTGVEHSFSLPPGQYRWRVGSVRADGDAGPFGDPQAFTLKPVPPAPPVQPPQLSADGIVLRWGAGEAGQRYELQLARDTAFTDLVLQQPSDIPEATLALPPPGRYLVRVRAIDADGFAGPWGGAQQIEVPHSRWWLLFPAVLLLLTL